jgi:hypothetical protein
MSSERNEELEKTVKEVNVAQLQYYHGICMERLRQTIKNLTQDSWYPAKI